MFNFNWLRRLNPFANERLTSEEFLQQLKNGRRVFRDVDVTDSLIIQNVTIGGDLEISGLRVKGDLIVNGLTIFGWLTLGKRTATGSIMIDRVRYHRNK